MLRFSKKRNFVVFSNRLFKLEDVHAATYETNSDGVTCDLIVYLFEGLEKEGKELRVEYQTQEEAIKAFIRLSSLLKAQ